MQARRDIREAAKKEKSKSRKAGKQEYTGIYK
jgi:hypothetical protein